MLLADAEASAAADAEEEQIPEAPAQPVTRPGDIWCIAGHHLICGDCRDRGIVNRLLGGVKANLVITSPPYATQREHDPESGFTPVPPEAYCGWFRVVAANIAAVLTPDGSYFLNTKEHAEGGRRSLYVKDLVVAHVRQWGWWCIDELCWRKPMTACRVDGGIASRMPGSRSSISPFQRRGSSFGPRRSGMSPRTVLGTRRTTRNRTREVVSSPFPRALVEFFVKAFSDPGDIAFDAFLGSASSIAAAAVLDRVGYGIEISPAYCDVAVHRIANLTGEEPVLAETGQAMAEVAAERGVPMEQVENPRLRDARRIRHKGVAPFYGSRRSSAGPTPS